MLMNPPKKSDRTIQEMWTCLWKSQPDPRAPRGNMQAQINVHLRRIYIDGFSLDECDLNLYYLLLDNSFHC